jgi:hypothetical protein
MKRLFEILISTLAGVLLLLLYANFGGDKLFQDNFSIAGLAALVAGLFVSLRVYLKKYWKK